MESSSNIKVNRILYLDVLRVIACLAVIMIHSSASYVLKDIGSINFWIGNIFDSISRIGVPIFVMISGALLLDKSYDFSTKKMKKHIKKMIIFFIGWSGIYCIVFDILIPILYRHQTISTLSIITSFLKGPYHLWYVYLIIGLYLISPLLRLWVSDKNKKHVKYFIMLSFVFTCLLPESITIGYNYSNLFSIPNYIIEELSLEYIGGFTFYFILGWYLHNYEIKNKKIIYLFGIVGLLITIFGTYVISSSTGKAIQLYGGRTINVFFQSSGIFLFIKEKYKNIENKYKAINYIAKMSLGIYAIHVAIVTIMFKIMPKIGFENAIINIFLVFIVSFGVSFLLTYIISKIPILKRIV